ncbi:hypothetical protein CJF30_00011246 [Rutstroemia sp. NJR-2017a BBW]|nr:hypothetical protein CJF30_00011246 [Rutstroemia sp. NJR-2017a BBW]
MRPTETAKRGILKGSGGSRSG